MDKKFLTREQRQEKIVAAWSRMIDCIAHDITTPMAVARMSAESLMKHFLTLIAGYKQAVAHKIIDDTIDKRYLQLIEDSPQKIQDNIADVFTFLALVHTLKQPLLQTADQSSPLVVSDHLYHSLNHYPFTDDERQISITVDYLHTFNFHCQVQFLDHLFLNLLANALQSIRQNGGGHITIWSEEHETCFVIHYKDTGRGVSEYMMPQLFNRFFSERNASIVPGLGFCRLALLQNGGDITCTSLPKEYTEFHITFPK